MVWNTTRKIRICCRSISLTRSITMNDTRKTLTLAVEIGDTLLSSGGEIYRTQDTILRILHAFGIAECDVYVLTNGIFASANESLPDACSIVRNVSLGSVHLGKVAAINQLSREIAEGRVNETEAAARLREIRSMQSPTRTVQLLAGGVGSACFTLLFGGRLPDAFCAFFIGILLQVFLRTAARKKTSRFITNAFGAALVTALSLVSLKLPFPLSKDFIIIGDIMPLVPGIALTTSFRNLFYGDYLSGAINLLDALLTAACIAVGVGSIIAIGGMLP